MSENEGPPVPYGGNKNSRVPLISVYVLRSLDSNPPGLTVNCYLH